MEVDVHHSRGRDLSVDDSHVLFPSGYNLSGQVSDTGGKESRCEQSHHRRNRKHGKHTLEVGASERVPHRPKDMVHLRHRTPNPDPKRRLPKLRQHRRQIIRLHPPPNDPHQHPLLPPLHRHHRRKRLPRRPLPHPQLHAHRPRHRPLHRRQRPHLPPRPVPAQRRRAPAARLLFARQRAGRHAAEHGARAVQLPRGDQEDDHDGAAVPGVLRGECCGAAVLS